ncbi:unnamed protein product [Notodromas monacha]|uniref:Cuticle protein CPCFC domain-containing protein n=1 Tax=Notodromas monacha TaxID=399045 RepID=A0A7R9GGU8_9CRUS|nr:unnamed protein product [Notodromas monacha]CAG0920605.1 unnamed protein product [Notodromas monacha]
MASLFQYSFVIICCAVIAQGSSGDRFPVGVDPAACPNYPFCDVNTDPRGHQQSPHGYSGPIVQNQHPQQYNPASRLAAAYGPSSNAISRPAHLPQQQYIPAPQPAPYNPHQQQYNPAYLQPQQPAYQAQPQPQHHSQAPPRYQHVPAPAPHHQPAYHTNSIHPQSRSIEPAFPKAPVQHYNQPQQVPSSGHGDLGGAKYPAGVDPASCPNFPYCHNGGSDGNHQVATRNAPQYHQRQQQQQPAHAAGGYPGGAHPHGSFLRH